MNGPLVSIVTPTFNHARYLGKCIESLQAQTYPRWELVIVDDGSTDGTEKVVAQYADKDPRIRYVRQENQGVTKLGSTINRGVGLTSGELVTMFASDDIWPSDRLERQVPVFADPRVVLCLGRGRLIGPDGEDLGDAGGPRKLPYEINRPPGSILSTLLLHNWIPQYTVLIRRSALDAIGGYLQPPPLLSEDASTHMALAFQGEFRFIDATLGYYRMHPTQMTRQHRLAMAKTDLDHAKRFFGSLSPEQQAITTWTRETLAREADRILRNAHFEQGRRELIAGDRGAARRSFHKALREGAPATKLKALLGLGCATTGLDLERVVALTGRPRLR